MTTVPNIPNTDRIADYTATSGQTDFAIPWVVIADTLAAAVNDLVVNVDGVAIDLSTSSFVGVAITGLSGIWTGGILTIPACTAGQRVVIYSKREPRRTSSFLEGKSLPFTTLDQLMDDVVLQMRDLDLGVRRALKLTPEQYLDGGSASDVVADVAAFASSAAASATAATSVESAVAADLTIIQNYGKYKGVNNIFDQINDLTVIAAIQTGSPTIYLDSYVAAAIAKGGTWLFPAGTYHFTSKIVMAPGVEFWGAGIGSTVFYLGGDGIWGMEMLNANGINQVEAFKLKDIQFQLTNGGIRWNSLTGGFTDDNTSQAYMMRPRMERCMVLNDNGGTHFIGVQLSKCFNGVIRDNYFVSNSVSIQLMGSDINDISNNRSDSPTDCCIQIESNGTFGSFNRVAHNDLNNPKNCFYRGSDRAGYFGFNHCELDFSPGSTGAGGNMPAMIDLLGTGNPFTTVIENNGIEGDVFADRWLRFRGQSTVYSLTVINNRGADTFHSIADIGEFPYFTNAGDRAMCVHCGNGGTDVFFPMNTQGDSVDDAANVYFVFNASRPGLSYANSTIKPNCVVGDVVLHPDTNTAHFIEISDWTGQPNNQMIGHFNIAAVLYADVSGQQMRYDVLDNGVSLIGGWQTYTASAANMKELIALASAVTVATKLQVRFQNIDNTRNTRGYIHQVVGGFA